MAVGFYTSIIYIITKYKVIGFDTVCQSSFLMIFFKKIIINRDGGWEMEPVTE